MSEPRADGMESCQRESRSTIRKERGSYDLPAHGARGVPAGATTLDGALAAGHDRLPLPVSLAGPVRIVDADMDTCHQKRTSSGKD